MRAARGRAAACVWAAVVAVAIPGGLAAAPGGEQAGLLAGAVERAIARVRVARRHAPDPVRVTWQKRHLGSITLSGPLLDLSAADLTGDGRDEILALAPGEGVAISRREPGELEIVGSLPFDELALAPIRPRDPVGSSAIVSGSAGVQWWARSSERAEAAVIAWTGGRLELVRAEPGYPICHGTALELQEGRNTFAPSEPGGEALHGAACRDDVVGPDGWALDVAASVTVEGELEVSAVPRCPDDTPCPDAVAARAADRGYAIALGDLDRDGHPEVATSARRPAGEPDAVEVGSLREDGIVSRHRAEFSGPIAGLAIGDISGDGRAQLLVAVRAPGHRRVELYSLL